MRHRNIFAAFALVLLVAAVPAFASHGWGNYHWPRSTAEASITIYRSLTQTTYANWPDHLQKSVYGDPNNPNTANRRGWNDSSVLALTIAASGTDSTTRYNCSAPSNAIRVCNYPYGSTGWLGLAQVWPDSNGHITRANTKVNDTYFGSNYPRTEQRHVMCQEVGHDFGLGHTSENGTSQNTCMDYYQNTSNTDWTSTGPNQHDFDQLKTQHHASLPSPGDVLATSLRAGSAFDDADLNQPWQWGTPIAWDREGRAVSFRLDPTPNHGGDEVYTHVYWARDPIMERPNFAPDTAVVPEPRQ